MEDIMSTFLRREVKYLLDDRQYLAFRKAIEPHTKADDYAKYTICNLYYDTDSFALVRQSIEKPVYKEKLRLRSYGTPGENDTVFLELKKKFRQDVFKRRIALLLRDVMPCLEQDMQTDAAPQVLREIAYFMALYHPQPKVFIVYDRVALKGIEDEGLRITFDEHIRYRSDHLRLSDGDAGRPLLREPMHLTEIKVPGAIPLWLSHALAAQQIYPTSFSKYGYCYRHCLVPGTAEPEGADWKQIVA